MKIMTNLARLTLLSCFVCISIAQVAAAQDNWPQWRGAKLDNVSAATNLPAKLDESTQAWKLKMPGPAGASPVVWGDNIYATSVDGSGLSLMCISSDGKEVWKKPLAGKNKNSRDRGNSASPSPMTDGKHVWVMSIGTLQCFDTKGELVWKKDLEEEYGKFEIQFGMTSTPILHDGRVYVQLIHGKMRERGTTSVGWIVALDAKDGKEIWKHKRKTEATAENKHAYSSPVVFDNDGQSFLITHGGDYAIGHSLKDGSEIWRCGGLNPKDSYNPYLRLVSSPVCAGDLIVIPSAKNGPVLGLKPDLKGNVTEQADARVWTLKKGTPDVATPVVHDGLVYLSRENGVFSCVDAKTGKKLYSKRIVSDKHRSSPVVADGKIYLLGRKGKAIVVKPGRELEIVSTSELSEEITASPAVAGGTVYVRTYDSLIAFRKNTEKTAESSSE